MTRFLSSPSSLRRTAALLMVAVGLAACSDDDGNGPTATTPANVAAAQVSLTRINLTWDVSSGATSYIVDRTSSATPGTFTTVASPATNAFVDSNVTSANSYGYRVAAVAGSDTSAFSAVVNFQTGLQAATLTGNIAASRTLYTDTVYKISGYVKVQNGAVLTIQPGTRLIGDTTIAGSSLWILRGARIEASGTAAQPIVFTSARAVGNRKPGDWGGLIIIGNGIINRTEVSINTEGGAAGQAENYAGGTDNNSNSGTLRYVRIEFAGYDVSGGAGQELNSLSMYAVGRGTTLEYVQTMAGLDDSFEWWGGAVDGRYLVSYESGDDHFDWTEGYKGRNQFLIALQTQRLVPAAGAGVFSSDPKGFEGDGCDPGVTGTTCQVTTTLTSSPYSMPVFANFTMVGPGNLAGIPADGNGGTWRRGTGGTWRNGVLARWKGIAINIRDAWSDSLFIASNGRDSLDIQAVLLTQNGFNYDTAGAGFAQSPGNWVTGRLATHKAFATTVLVDTLLGIITNPAGLDWTPKAGSPASTGGLAAPAARVTGYFGNSWVNTTYLGAADPAGGKWWQGWTSYAIN